MHLKCKTVDRNWEEKTKISNSNRIGNERLSKIMMICISGLISFFLKYSIKNFYDTASIYLRNGFQRRFLKHPKNANN